MAGLKVLLPKLESQWTRFLQIAIEAQTHQICGLLFFNRQMKVFDRSSPIVGCDQYVPKVGPGHADFRLSLLDGELCCSIQAALFFVIFDDIGRRLWHSGSGARGIGRAGAHFVDLLTKE